MKIDLNVDDSDIQKGITVWTAHRTAEAIDSMLTGKGFTDIIKQQVIAQVRPMLDQIMIDMPLETVQKYTNKYVTQYMQNEVRKIVRHEMKDRDWAKAKAIAKEILQKKGL